jgi:transporter family-2 protein
MFALFAVGVAAGALITLQSVANAGLGKRAGNLGAVFVLTVISSAILLSLLLLFPSLAALRQLPGPSQGYLYIGAILGILIVAAPIFLVPRIGTTATLTTLVVGQLGLAVLVDHFGLFGAPRTEISPVRIAGVVLLVLGTLCILRK